MFINNNDMNCVCFREELRRWFIAQELDLFRFRFQNENKDNIKLFLEKNNLNYDLVSTVYTCYNELCIN